MDDVTRLTWEKQSHVRYTARLGPVRLEVRKVGAKIAKPRWTVGEVMGVHHHDREKYPDCEFLHDAQILAEECAKDLFRAIALEIL